MPECGRGFNCADNLRAAFCQELLYFGALRHGGLRAFARHADGRGSVGKPRRCPRVLALLERHGKCAVETVARAHSVDGIHLEWLDPLCFFARNRNEGPFGAALQDYAAQTFRMQPLRGVLDALLVAHVKRRLGFVGVNHATWFHTASGKVAAGAGSSITGTCALAQRSSV